MPILPDLLGPGLKLVIVGTAAGRASAKQGFYYAGKGNRFWRVLHEVGLTPIELQPAECGRLLHYGIGLTDLAKYASGMDADLPKGCFDTEQLRRSRLVRNSTTTQEQRSRGSWNKTPRRSSVNDGRSKTPSSKSKELNRHTRLFS